MNDILTTIRDYWAITMAIVGLFISYIWLKLDSRYVKQSDLTEFKRSVSNVKSRVEHIEEDLKQLPKAEDIAKLRISITEMRGESKAIFTKLESLQNLVQLLIEDKVQEGKKNK